MYDYNTKIIKSNNDFYIIKDKDNYVLLKYDEEKNSNIISKSNYLESIEKEFNVISSTPKRFVFKTDPSGYPINSELLAFSIDEKPSHPDLIVYYMVNHKGDLEKNEALIGFAKKCLNDIDSIKSKVLSNSLKYTFDKDEIIFSNRMVYIDWKKIELKEEIILEDYLSSYDQNIEFDFER